MRGLDAPLLETVDLSIAEQVTSFAQYLQVSKACAPGTIRAYTREVEQFLESLNGAPPTGEAAQAETIRRGGKASTVTRRLSAFKAWGRSIRAKEFLAELEEIERPKRPKGLPKPVPDWRERIAGAPEKWRARATLIAMTGLRISEADALYEPDPGKFLRVMGKGSKERMIPLMPEAVWALRVLGGRMGVKPRAIQRYFRKHFNLNPHALRHTFACELAASGADLAEIQDLLGHSSPVTTRVYAAFDMSRLQAAMERRVAILGGNL